MTNIGEGLKPLGDLPSGIIGKIGGLSLIGPAIASFVLSLGAVALTDTVISTFKKVWNFLTGSELETNQNKARQTQIQQIVESLTPLNDLDTGAARKMDIMTSAFRKFATAIKEITRIDSSSFQENFVTIGNAMADQINIIDAMVEGKSYNPRGFMNKLTFNKSIFDPSLRLDDLVEQMAKIQFAFGQRDNPFINMESRGMTLNEALNERNFTDLLGGPDTIISAPDNRTTINNTNAQAIVAGDNAGFNPNNLLFRDFR